ncbi:hypothetical protein [Nannocystis pusilla]|uniref:Uncharacterized protein n=1 Tax=Nannocystis pusilla TaxID=889268 RepID=A0ABS7U471_9BACT|nr:hypothetical protein [Nannocystis pusilla]MBZ5715265.1 hypothetical protein [Nannocystis pusilla]
MSDRPQRLEAVVAQLGDLGIEVRVGLGLSLVLLELETAETIARLLQDLQKIETRGHV